LYPAKLPLGSFDANKLTNPQKAKNILIDKYYCRFTGAGECCNIYGGG